MATRSILRAFREKQQSRLKNRLGDDKNTALSADGAGVSHSPDSTER